MSEQPLIRGRIPFRISLAYAAIGGFWILFSDVLLSQIFQDPVLITRLQIFKGWLFICVTAIILFFLVRRDIAALERSERAVRESEKKFHMLIENTASAIFIYRDNILHANNAMESLTGYSREELLRMGFFDLVHPDFREDIRKHCEAFARGEAIPLRCEYKIIIKSGEERWIDFTSSVISYDDGSAGLGTAFDITELRKTLEALTESEERFRLLVDRVTDYEIFMLDPGGHIVSWNIGAERSKGYTASEIIGRPHAIFFTEEDIKKGVPGRELKIAAEEGKYEDEGWRVRKDRSRFWANVVTTALRDKKGYLRGYAKVVRDITDRKMAEEKLRESEERHRVIAETASDAVITIDEDSTITFANPAVRTIFGYEPVELIGQKLTVLMPERLKGRHLAGVQRYLETGKKKVRWEALEVPGLHRSGHEIPLEISYGVFQKDDRYFFTGIVRDVTERKQAEKEKQYKDMLERFNQELETLVAERTMSLIALKLADRVRTPATVIEWSGKKMLAKDDVPEALKRELTAIIEEAEKLEAIVKDFQALLKSERPQFNYEDINAIVRGGLSIVEREAAGKRIGLEVRMSDRSLKVNAQKDLLRMAVFNLLRNAIESTPEGGRITVVTEEEGENIVVSISDTGHGIPREILDRIFDPLFSAKIYRFGMGLPLIKQIVSEHLGEITVESELGKGTTFRLLFPARWMTRAAGAGYV